jgi:formylglycine-generating enzyme required for sulfatase activity
MPLRMVLLEQVANHPVSVSLAEAQAYCQWYQKKYRLTHLVTVPTEDQWLQAIECTSKYLPPLYHNLDQCQVGQIGKVMETREMTPNPILENSYGVSHLVGNAWELTDTPHHPFRGFTPENLYPDYSKDFFSGCHYVCKGASWATPIDMVRPSFRNFYQDLYTYHITQFRLACQDPHTVEGNLGENSHKKPSI